MDELVERLRERVGLDEAAAREALVILVEFLSREAPAEAMSAIGATVPGVAEIAARPTVDTTSRHFGRHFGGMAKLMDVANRMMGCGLTMSQVQATVRETVGYARERAGDAVVDEIVVAVPGLGQVV